jgi:hypothetical protein
MYIHRHFVFSAGLIILSNEFASLYNNQEADTAIKSCISILKYCAESDAQAVRVKYIIETFHDANLSRPERARNVSLPGRQVPVITAASNNNPGYDPMKHFFSRSRRGPNEKHHQSHPSVLAPGTKRERPFMSVAHHQSMSSNSSLSSISTASMRPIMPPSSATAIHQQPSPEATSCVSPANSSNSGSGHNLNAATSVSMSAVMSSSSLDAMNVSEFHFDSLYPPWNQQQHDARSGAGGGDVIMAMAHHPQQPQQQHPHRVDSGSEGYGAYRLGASSQPPPQHPVPLGTGMDGGVHAPLYTTSEFR